MADTCSTAVASDVVVEEQVDLHSGTEQTSRRLIPNEADPLETAPKRPAVDALQNDISKAAKLSHNDDALEVSETVQGKDEIIGIEQKVAKLGQQLKRTNDEFDACIAEKAEFQKRNDELLCQLAEIGKIPGNQRIRSKNETTRVRALAKAMLQEERQNIKADYTQKLETEKRAAQAQYGKKLDVLKKSLEKRGKALKEQYTDKIEELERKHEAQMRSKEKEVNAIKSKAEREAAEFKTCKAQHAEEVKSLKAEHKSIQKELKAEQAETIKYWKPEHSKAVKEKHTALKDKEKELAHLEEMLKNLREEKVILAKKLSDVEAVRDDHEKTLAQKQEEADVLKFHLDNRNDDVRRVLSEKEDLKQALDKEKEKLKVAYEANTKHQAKQWQVQHDKAEYMAQGAMQHQRINFVLRHTLESRQKKIEEMQTELKVLKEQIRGPQECTNEAEGGAPQAGAELVYKLGV